MTFLLPPGIKGLKDFVEFDLKLRISVLLSILNIKYKRSLSALARTDHEYLGNFSFLSNYKWIKFRNSTPFSGRCSLSLPPDNIRKPQFSHIFRGYRKEHRVEMSLLFGILLNDTKTECLLKSVSEQVKNNSFWDMSFNRFPAKPFRDSKLGKLGKYWIEESFFCFCDLLKTYFFWLM